MNAPVSNPADMSNPFTAGSQDSWFHTMDHDRISTLFVCWTLGAFLLGALLSLWLTLKSITGEAGDVGSLFQIITYHRLVLVFLFLVPAIPSILGYRMLPQLIGADEFAFPALSRCSLRFYVVGLGLLILSILVGPVATGWTLPTPLSLGANPGFGFMALGLFFLAASWFVTGLNFIVTVHYRRGTDVDFFSMPLMAWGLYLGAYQLAFAGIMFAIVVMYLAGGQWTGRGLFGEGTDPLLWQNYFWFAMRPAAFFALIPAAGVISAVVERISRKEVTGYRLVVGSMIALLGLGLTTWGVHLAGWGQDAQVTFAFSILALLGVIPVALIAYCWLATIYQGANHLPAPSLFTMGFFLMAGITVLMELFLRSPGLGSYLANTMFASAQMDYLIWGALMSALLAGLHTWYPEVTGRSYNASYALFGGFLYLAGLNLALVPHLIMGTRGVAADMMVLEAGSSTLPGISLVGWSIAVLGLLAILGNLGRAVTDGEPAATD